MRKRTYHIFIALAVIVVALSAVLAISSINKKPKVTVEVVEQPKESNQPTETPNKSNNDSSDQEEEPNLQKSGTSTFEIHFFDVGEADAALIECDGHFMLIDGGNPGNSSFLYSYLNQHHIDYLDYIICSHAHTDHVGGLAGALNYASVGTAYSPVKKFDNRAFNSLIKYLTLQNKEITIPTAGESIPLGTATVSFLGPIDMELAETNENNSSLIVKIEYGDTSFLFTGDAEAEEELSLVDAHVDLKSTLLKVAHHGSYTSSTAEFMSAVNPDYAIISVGKDNEYGHPHDVALERIAQYCPVIYRTDINGEIICSSDGAALSFSFSR